MTTVKYYDQVDDSLLKFAVIITKTDGKFIILHLNKREFCIYIFELNEVQLYGNRDN